MSAFMNGLRVRAARVRSTLRLTLTGLGVPPAAIGLALAAGLFTAQNLELAYYASQSADSRAVIKAIDDDAANAIDVAQRSRWVTDNGFMSYGPLYFRLSSTLTSFLSPILEPGELTPEEGRTKTEHLGLMLTSEVALATLAFFLAYLITQQLWLTFILATAFEWAFLRSPSWRYLFVKAHPDMVLALVVAIAATLTLRLWRAPRNDHLLRGTAWAWGAAFATKFSVLMTMPFVFVPLLITQAPRERVRRALTFFTHILIAYFVIGFPQNFNLPRTLRFLKSQAEYSLPATRESVTEWLSFYGDQVWLPLAVALSAALILGVTRPARARWREWAFALALGFGPLLMVLPQRVLVPHDHYPMPIVASQLALLLSLLAPRPATGRRRALLAIVALGVLYWRGTVPTNLGQTLNEQLTCRPEIRSLFREVVRLRDGGHVVFSDPYTPMLNKMKNLRSNWGPSVEYLAEGGFTALILNRHHRSQYFDEEKIRYFSVYNHGWTATREFYRRFEKTKSVDDPVIGRWRMQSEDACGREIWLKEGAGPAPSAPASTPK